MCYNWVNEMFRVFFFSTREFFLALLSFMLQHIVHVVRSGVNLNNSIGLFVCPQMDVLGQKLLKELPDEARVVACRFPFPQWPCSASEGQGLDQAWAYDMAAVRGHLRQPFWGIGKETDTQSQTLPQCPSKVDVDLCVSNEISGTQMVPNALRLLHG